LQHTIYERIEHLIDSRNMTKKSFCEELKISTGNLGEWKRGNSVPSAKKLIEIAGYFKISLDWLMTGKDPGAGTELHEEPADYFFTPEGQLNCRLEDLPQKEREFIREYLEFTEYRRNKKGKS
jgi:transcriptional regulator with XRE-family HTH domain